MKLGIYFENSNYAKMFRGPEKVARNLLKGLDILNIEYLINQDGDYNIILQNSERIKGDLSNCFLGPNICTLPIDNQFLMSYDNYIKTIVPCEWVKSKYSRWIPEEKIEIWPVGIDTDLWIDTKNFKKEYDFLIYFKRRNPQDLIKIQQFLIEKNKTFLTLHYGNYSESEFFDIISKCKYAFIIDGCESQGLAIQEIMSCNLPIIVWDKIEWLDRGDEFKFSATSVPYFENDCGLKFDKISDLESTYNLFLSCEYNSRQYIVDNLSIKSSTKKILKIINESNKQS